MVLWVIAVGLQTTVPSYGGEMSSDPFQEFMTTYAHTYMYLYIDIIYIYIYINLYLCRKRVNEYSNN